MAKYEVSWSEKIIYYVWVEAADDDEAYKKSRDLLMSVAEPEKHDDINIESEGLCYRQTESVEEN